MRRMLRRVAGIREGCRTKKKRGVSLRSGVYEVSGMDIDVTHILNNIASCAIVYNLLG
jgi:hypothetical protein